MNGRWKSDVSVVPGKPSNKEGTGRVAVYGEPYTGTKAETPDTAKGEPTGELYGMSPTAEGVEGRETTKGNSRQPTRSRTQRRIDLQQRLARVRSVAARRLSVATQGKSPVREIRSLGSVRGASGNRGPYRDTALRAAADAER